MIYIERSYSRYFRLGRHALHAALGMLDIKPGDRILIPAYICRDLLSPIYRFGAQPVYYAVDEHMNPTCLPEIEGVRAVLAVNFFGFPQDLALFRSYCDRRKIALIEDNAHGYLSCDESGTPLGTRGDFGIFSFRKTFLLPDGAALFVNNPAWHYHMPSPLTCREETLPIAFRIKQGLSWFQRKTNLSLFTFGQNFIRHLRYLRTGHAITPLPSESEFEMPLEPAPHCLSIRLLNKLDRNRESIRRRDLYAEFEMLLADLPVRPVFLKLPTTVVPYGFPFYSEDKNVVAVMKLARERGLDCMRWPDLPASVAPEAPLHYKTLWMVNFLC